VYMVEYLKKLENTPSIWLNKVVDSTNNPINSFFIMFSPMWKFYTTINIEIDGKIFIYIKINSTKHQI
jgi:hypothetical protein